MTSTFDAADFLAGLFDSSAVPKASANVPDNPGLAVDDFAGKHVDETKHDAPEGALTPDLLDRLKTHKAKLLASIERFDERAAIMEFDADLSRSEAEQRAWNEYFT